MTAPYRLQTHVVIDTSVSQTQVSEVTITLRTTRKSSRSRQPHPGSDMHRREDRGEGRRRCDCLCNSNDSRITVTRLVIPHSLSFKNPVNTKDHIGRTEDKTRDCWQLTKVLRIKFGVVSSKRGCLNVATEQVPWREVPPQDGPSSDVSSGKLTKWPRNGFLPTRMSITELWPRVYLRCDMRGKYAPSRTDEIVDILER